MQPENLISAVLMTFINWFLGVESIFDPNVAFMGHATVWAWARNMYFYNAPLFVHPSSGSVLSISQFSSLSTREGQSEASSAQSAVELERWGCRSNHVETGANCT